MTFSEVKECQDRTRTDPDFSSDFHQIVDMRAVTSFHMTASDVRMLARRMMFSSVSKRAFVASSPYVFGMGRMWQAFIELSEHPSEVRVFDNLRSALRWFDLTALPAPVKSERLRIEAECMVELEES